MGRNDADHTGAVTGPYCMFPEILFDLKTCGNSKCYSDLCASNKTRGAVGGRFEIVSDEILTKAIDNRPS